MNILFLIKGWGVGGLEVVMFLLANKFIFLLMSQTQICHLRVITSMFMKYKYDIYEVQ